MLPGRNHRFASAHLRVASKTETIGFSLIELIVATTITIIVVLGSIEIALRSLRIYNQGVAREALEAAISEDIAWLRAYSKSWHCEVGPYEGCKIRSQGLASAVNYRPEIFSADPDSDYQQFKAWCLNRYVPESTATPAHQLLYEASLTDSDGVYDPPNPVTVNKIALNLENASSLAQKYNVYRTIEIVSHSEEFSGNAIRVRYFTEESDPSYIKINKSEQLFIEATAWCP